VFCWTVPHEQVLPNTFGYSAAPSAIEVEVVGAHEEVAG
jgi:hypothetical protein